MSRGCIPRGEYPPEWPELARQVKDDAGWRCVRCGHPHDPGAGRTLTVHHFDGDKANCQRYNLMALCQACHLSVQARVDPAQGLLTWEAVRLWAWPYVAGCIEAGGTLEPGGWDKDVHQELVMRYEAVVGEWPTWAPRL